MSSLNQISDLPAYLTPPEAAKFLSVSVGALGVWRREHRGPKFYRLNHSAVRYLASDLIDYMAERAAGGRAQS
jgi:Helix-turn-helix domain